MVDSQAVKNTNRARKETKGFCHYKKVNGIKRHVMACSTDYPIGVTCTPANVSDDDGLVALFEKHIDYFKAKPMNIPKIIILVDNGYHPKSLAEKLEKIYSGIMKKIKFQISPKPQKNPEEPKGFKPEPTRWKIERVFSWVEQARSLVKNFEASLETAATKLELCLVRLMLKRLAEG